MSNKYVIEGTEYIEVSRQGDTLCLESTSRPLKVIYKTEDFLKNHKETEERELLLDDGTLVYYQNEWFIWTTSDKELEVGYLADLDGTCLNFPVHYTEVYTEEEVAEPYQEEPSKALRYNQGKPRPTLIDPDFIMGLAEVLEMGAQKYGDYNWQKGMDQKDIMDSLMRHSLKYLSGSERDEESGLHEMLHIAANAMFVYYFDKEGQ